jgi:hypothetical protein
MGRRWHEAAPQQPMLQQLRQPGGIGHVVLRPGRILTWRALTSSSWKPRSSNTCHTGFQLLAGGFHHHLGDAFGGQPVGQRLQSRGEGWEAPDLLAAAAFAGRHPHTGHDLVLGHIQAGAARYQQLHHGHLLPHRRWCPAGPTDQATLKDVLTATVRGAGKAPASVVSTGSAAPRRAELGRAPRFSSLVAAPGHAGLIRHIRGMRSSWQSARRQLKCQRRLPKLCVQSARWYAFFILWVEVHWYRAHHHAGSASRPCLHRR